MLVANKTKLLFWGTMEVAPNTPTTQTQSINGLICLLIGFCLLINNLLYMTVKKYNP